MGASSDAQKVDVSADMPVLNYDSPDFTASLNQNAIDNIPVNNRRWSALALTTPGVVADSSGFGLVSIRGISPILNNVEIDGADDNNAYYSEERGRTREAYSTSENAVREFAVNTGVYSAEYGRAAGGVINSVTKSGGNDFHGLLYFYDRESNWNAYQEHSVETIANYTGSSPIPTSFTTGIHFKPEDVRKIYGFTVSGPIIKDKLFFMYTYDQHSRIFPAIGAPGTPGTFFAQPAAALPTGAACNAATGYLSGDTAALDQQACTLAARELAAGVAAPSGTTAGTYAAGAAAYSQGLASLLPDLGYSPREGYQEINTPKLDWQVNSKEHVSLLGHRLRWDSPGGVQTASVLGYAKDTDGNDFVKVDYLVGKLTSLISPRISNEIVYQYGRELLAETQQPFSAYTLANLVAKNGNIPEVDLDGSTGFYLGSPYYSYRPAQPDERKWQVEDTLYSSIGNHSLKYGVDILHNTDTNNALNQGAPLAGGNGTAANGMYYYTYIGNYFSDLATKNGVGTCNSTQSSAATATVSAVGTYQCYATNGYGQAFGNPLFAISTTDLGFFVQDNWKFSPRLTLELGVRYDYEILPTTASQSCQSRGPADGESSQRQEQHRTAHRRFVRRVRRGQDGCARRIRFVLRPHHQRRSVERTERHGQHERPVPHVVLADRGLGWFAGLPLQQYGYRHAVDAGRLLSFQQLAESYGGGVRPAATTGSGPRHGLFGRLPGFARPASAQLPQYQPRSQHHTDDQRQLHRYDRALADCERVDHFRSRRTRTTSTRPTRTSRACSATSTPTTRDWSPKCRTVR